MPLLLDCVMTGSYIEPQSCYIQEAKVEGGGTAALIRFLNDRVVTLFGERAADGFVITSIRIHDPFKEDAESDMTGKCFILPNAFLCSGNLKSGRKVEINGLPPR